MNIGRIFLNLLIYLLINHSKCCSIFPSLNCSCFQSDTDLYNSLPIQTYSHLYCQGYSLDKNTFEQPFGWDFYSQNRFRTISLEFFLNNQIKIDTNQFNSLALLTSQTNFNEQIEISIRLNGFTQIQIHKQSISSNIFQQKHQRKHLSLYLTPKTLNHIQKESGEENWNQIDEQFDISENSLSGLIVSQMNLYIHTYKDYFPRKYSFEYLFNNTNIGELHFYGSIIHPGSLEMRKSFKGLIRSLTLHRHVDIIDSQNYPYYFSVYSYNIHSIEAHSIDLQSFIPHYKNLRGLNIIKPRFDVSIDRLIPTLDSLSLDIEDLNDRTILTAKHINYFKLSSRLRRIEPQALNSLYNHLKTFDLSEINLSEMTPDSRCYLIHFIYHTYQRSMNIILPEINYLNECDCARLVLQYLQSIELFREYSICSKQCRFSDCSTISLFFQEKYPLFNDHYPLKNTQQNIDADLPSVDLVADSIDLHMMDFLVNQTNQQKWSKFTRKIVQTTTTTTTTIPIFDDSDSLISKEDHVFNKSESFPWFPILIGFVIVSSLIVLFIIIFFITYKRRQRSKFVRVEL